MNNLLNRARVAEKKLFILLAAVLCITFVSCEKKETPITGGSRDAARLVLVNQSKYKAFLEIFVGGTPCAYITAEPNTTSEPAKVMDVMGAEYNGSVQVKIRVWDEEQVTDRTIYQESIWIDAIYIYTFTVHEDFSVTYEEEYAG